MRKCIRAKTESEKYVVKEHSFPSNDSIKTSCMPKHNSVLKISRGTNTKQEKYLP